MKVLKQESEFREMAAAMALVEPGLDTACMMQIAALTAQAASLRAALPAIQRVWERVAGTPTEEAQRQAQAAAEAVMVGEAGVQCALLRDLIGNPFRPLPVLNPALLTDEVIALAHTVYDQKLFSRLPELAQTFERAGCTNPDLLAHCRSPGPHVRGCWCVDLLLGKS